METQRQRKQNMVCFYFRNAKLYHDLKDQQKIAEKMSYYLISTLILKLATMVCSELLPDFLCGQKIMNTNDEDTINICSVFRIIFMCYF